MTRRSDKGHPHRSAERVVIPSRVARRAATRYVVDEHGCWNTTYSLIPQGYGYVGWHESGKGYGTTVHRAAWVHAHGQIPEGLTVDHRCRNRRCVNIKHLRLLPNLSNARRNHPAHSWPVGNGECIRGHHKSWWRPKSASRSKGYCHGCRMELQARRRGTVLRRDYTKPPLSYIGPNLVYQS